MPRADVFFERGRHHAVCQDYGVTSPSGDLVVLSDGCSSSPNTDVGARLLCLAAVRAPNLAQSTLRVIQQANNLREAMGLDPNCIDATLLALACDDASTTAIIWGDGAVVARKRDGTVIAHEVSCSGSAPPYLSYLLSSSRLAAYAQAGFGQVEVARWGDPAADTQVLERRTSQDIESGISFRFEGDFDAVLVFTDGYKTGTDPGGKPVDPAEVLLEMSRIQAGNFAVRRRFRMMVRDRGWSFGDDFGVGALTFLD